MFFALPGVLVFANDGGTPTQEGDCDACNQTPEHIETYFRVMDELLTLLPTQPDQQSENELKNIAISTRTDAEAVIVGTLVTTVISYDTLTSDIFADFKLMFGSTVVRRDRERFLDYDFKISQRVLDAGMSGKQLYKKVPKEKWEAIDNALAPLEYMSLHKVGDTYSFEGETYRTYAKFLWNMQSMMKKRASKKYFKNYLRLVGTGFDRSYTNPGDKASSAVDSENLGIVWDKVETINNYEYLNNLGLEKKDLLAGNIYVDIDTEKQMKVIREIAIEYVCATGTSNVCDNKIVSIKDMSNDLVEDVGKDLGESKNIIMQATNRLKGIFQGKNSEYDEAYQQRKEQLVGGRDSSNGLGNSFQEAYKDTSKVMRGNADSVVGLWNKGKNAWKTLSDSVKKPSEEDREIAGSTPLPASKAPGRASEKNADSPEEKEKYLEEVARTKENQPKVFDKSVISGQGSNTEIQQRQSLENELRNDWNNTYEGGKDAGKRMIYLETNVNRNVVETSVRRLQLEQLIGSPDEKKTASYAATGICKLQCPELGDKKCGDG